MKRRSPPVTVHYYSREPARSVCARVRISVVKAVGLLAATSA
ncbi:hypothetical protein [Actinoplanes sp. NPDC020271]